MNKKKQKRRVSVLVLLCLCVGYIFGDIPGGMQNNTQVLAATKDSNFTIKDGVLTAYSGSSLVVEVPDGVTRILGGFSGREDIERVILPDSVEYIDTSAFQGCTGLTEVVMPRKLKSLGICVFKNCTNLQTVDLSNTSLAAVPRETFYGCKNLTDVTLPETVLAIGNHAFCECEHLGRINLPEGLRNISEFAFDSCHSLCTIELPDSLNYIGESAFEDCIALESISIPHGITTIQENTFSGDYSLKSVYLPDSLQVILEGGLETSNHYAISGGQSGPGKLTNIYIPSSVEYIANKAFDQTGKTDVIKGVADSYAKSYAEKETLTFNQLSYDANITFNACGGKVDVAQKAVVTGQEYGKLPIPVLKGYTFTGWYADQNFKKQIKSTTIVKDASVTVYARWEKADDMVTYQGRSSDFTIIDGKLTKYTGYQPVVIVPESVTEIGVCAFEDCEFITTIILPNSLKKIEKLAFKGCKSLLALDIPKGVTEIPENMCEGCGALEKVTIPEGVTRIGEFAFNIGTYGGALREVSLPDSLQCIERKVFYYCTNLLSVDLPDSLTEIGNSAFHHCSSLRKVAVPAKVTILDKELFSKCDSLEDILLVDGLQKIGNEIFDSNAAFTNIYIPETVTEIDEKALDSTNLNAFTIEGIKGSTAYEYYEGTQNSSKFQDIEVSFKELSYNATIQFDTQVSGITAESKKVIVGKGYGLLPTLEQEGKEFKGWSTTKDGNDLVKSTDLVESQTVTLYAVWKDPLTGEETKTEKEEEPDGIPTLLPTEDGQENAKNVEYTDIATAADLSKIRENLAGNYRLTADIDLSAVSAVGGTLDLDGYGWRPIGASKEGSCQAFTGIFDGAGHSIKGLTMVGEVPYTNVGLFARVEGGTIKNLTLENSNIEIGGMPIHSGILAGYVDANEEIGNDAVIENCAVIGGKIKFVAAESVNSKNITIGGCVGYMGMGTLTTCKNSAEVSYYSNAQEKPDAACSRFLGGIAGYLSAGTITMCSNNGAVNCFRNYYGDFTAGATGDLVAVALSGCDIYGVTGGICGVGEANGTICECYNTGEVSAYMFNEYNLFTLNVTSSVDTMAGGICGALYKSTQVLNCYNTGEVKSYADRNTTLVDKSASSENMLNTIMGMLDEITLCAPFQNATGYAAGIVGYSTSITSGPVKYCYNTGRLAGSKDAVYAIANGKVPVAYCRYAAKTLKDKEGNQADLIGSPEYANSITRCQSLSADKMNLCESYRSFDFANTWFLINGNDMKPQLYSNMVSNVKAVAFLETGTLKTEYEYGEKLDLTGLQVSVTLEGMDTPFVMDVSSNKECGYDPYLSGNQKLVVTYFGESKEIDVTVKEPKYTVAVNNGEGSGSYTKGATVTIIAQEPEETRYFKEWTVEDGNVTLADANSIQTTFVMGKEPVTITAVYGKKYQVVVNNGEGSGYYKPGDTVTIKAGEPAEGKQFSKWIVTSGGTSLITDNTLSEITFVMPEKKVEIEASYKVKEDDDTSCKDSAEHEWDTGKITKVPTCKEEGVMTYTCKKCQATKTEVIPKTEEHVWDDGVVTKEATATEKGTKTHTCTVCGKQKTEDIPATGTSTDPGKNDAQDPTATPVQTLTPDKTVTSNPTATPDKNASSKQSGNSGTQNSESATSTPAAVGKYLTVANKKCKVKVISSNAKNPTVAYVKTTDKKAKKITIPNTVSVNGVTYKVTKIAANACKNNNKITTVVIGKNITEIGKNAFAGCKNVKKVTMAAGKLKTVGKNAFKGINKKATIAITGIKKAKTALKKKLRNKKTGYVKTWKIK